MKDKIDGSATLRDEDRNLVADLYERGLVLQVQGRAIEFTLDEWRSMRQLVRRLERLAPLLCAPPRRGADPGADK